MKRRIFLRNSSAGLAGLFAGTRISGNNDSESALYRTGHGRPGNQGKSLKNWKLYALEENGELPDPDIDKIVTNREKVYDCRIPAQVHDVLTEKGIIDDPIKPGKQEPCLWVAQKDWIYWTTFNRVEAGRVFLNFRGLDTIADVYLNGRKIFSNRSCFLPARIDVTGRLLQKNVLLIHFFAPRPWLENSKGAQEFVDKGGDILRYIRKQREDFNFFNGPKPSFTPIGIYDEVLLEPVDHAEISWIDVEQFVDENLTRARLSVKAHIAKYSGVKTTCRHTLYMPGGDVYSSSSGGTFTIDHPELWFPSGYGAQPLYRLETELIMEGKTVDRDIKYIGIRKMVVTENFDVAINGKKVKLWGANLTQLPKASHVWDNKLFKTTMDLARLASMNSLRAWGPSHPWNDELFHEADKRGILIWSEFAHTGGPFPSSAEFIELCVSEAKNCVKKWKHHASLMLWCGGNESFLGINERKSPQLDEGNRKLFDVHYRRVCKKLDPQRLYIPNSPFGGGFKNDPEAGDSHIRSYDWYMPGMDFPVLPSENTRTTVALSKTLKQHLGDDLQWPEGGFIAHRTKDSDNILPPAWSSLIVANDWVTARLGHVEELYHPDGSPESLLFMLGAGCSKYIRATIGRYRRGKPHWQANASRQTRGHYWWKLNDTFPLIYSSLIDDLLEPNMSYYAIKRAYRPILVSIEPGDSINVWVVNDSGSDFEGTLVIRLLNRDGTEDLQVIQKDVRIEQGDSALVADCDRFGMFFNKNPLYAQLYDTRGNLITDSLEYITPENHNRFPDAKLSLEKDGDAIMITTDKIARWIELKGDHRGDEFKWYFEDNFFDLVPGQVKKVRLTGVHRTGIVRARPWYSKHESSIVLD